MDFVFLALGCSVELCCSTLCTSFTLYVPHHHQTLILLHGNTGGTTNKHCRPVWTAFLCTQHYHNTPNQRKQPPKQISGGSVCAWGAVMGVHSTLISHNVRFSNSFHITYWPFLFPSAAHAPNPHTKADDYEKSGKTKLITWGISTSQCCLKCNYVGLEFWLKLGWLQYHIGWPVPGVKSGCPWKWQQ